jgi:uracil-DNA glycosylase family 4
MKELPLARVSTVPAPFSEAGPGRAWCVRCGLANASREPYSRPFVPKGWTGRLLVIGSGRTEGRALMERLLRRAGYESRDVCFADPVRCVTTRPLTVRQIRACRPFLLRVIECLKPRAILACGSAAIRAVTNRGDRANVVHVRGRALPIPGILEPPVAYGTFDPGAVLIGNTYYESLIAEDIARLTWPELPWPKNEEPSGKTVGIDAEFTSYSILTFAVSGADSAVAYEGYDMAKAGRVLQEAAVVVGHNVFVDIDAAIRVGLPIKEDWVRGINVRDSLLLARMVDENRGAGGYDLETQLTSYFNTRPWKHRTEEISESDPVAWGPELRADRCRLDAWAAYKLVEKLEPLAKGPVEFTHRIAASLHRVRLAGVMLDKQAFESVAGQLYAERERARDLLTKAAFSYGMTEFSPTNDKHIRELLFERLGLDVVARTKTEGLPSVDKVTLAYHQNNDAVRLLAAFNAADKVCGLIDGPKGIRANVATTFDTADGPMLYLETNISPLGARTGRRSSNRPNMQNWKPVMRRLVRSRWSGGAILDADYKSLEPYILGWLARDDKYLTYFQEGKGYVGIAKEVYGRDVEKGTREYRVVKAIVLGTNYGAGAKKIANQLWIELGVKLSSEYAEHEREVERCRKKYLRAFPGIKRYMDKARHTLLTTGKVVTPTGRVRHMPVPQGERTPGFGHFLNSAYNFPIQSLASDVTGSALVDVEEAISREYGISYIELHRALLSKQWPNVPLAINEIHDELVYDLPPDDVVNRKRVVELIVETMRAVPTLRKVCPGFTLALDVEYLIGPTWGMKE